MHYSSGGVQSQTSDILDPVAGTITPGPNLPHMVYKHRMVKRPSDGLIFIIAGKTTYSDTLFFPDHHFMYSYNFDTDTWNMLRNLTLGKFAPGVVMTDNEAKIIVAAGKVYDKPTCTYTNDFSAEIYDISTDSWSPIAPMPDTTLQHSFLKVNDRMTALTNTADTAYQYDMATNTWNLMANVVTYSVNFDTIIAYIGDDYHQCG